jgi:polysaccharide biosynthesis/export protein
MKSVLRPVLTALVLWGQISVAAAAQEMVSTAAEGTTEAGKAGGQSGPALTGDRRPLYRLRNSDVLEISFTFATEFNQTITVQPDGFIVLKGLERQMYAEGTTLPELRDTIRQAYGQILHEPEISVVLKEFERPYFIASGEVSRPGKYDLRGHTTVVEAVAMAGGFTGQAKHSQVVLFRHVSEDVVESKLLNIKQMLSSRNLRENVFLRPGDMLFVPQSAISKLRRYLPSSNMGMYLNPAQY